MRALVKLRVHVVVSCLLSFACGSNADLEPSDALEVLLPQGGEKICGQLPSAGGLEVLFLETGTFIRSRDRRTRPPLLDELAASELLGEAQSFKMGGGILAQQVTAQPLTEKALEVFDLQNVFKGSGNIRGICWGERVVTGIESMTEPGENMGFVSAMVTFEHGIEPADWLKGALRDRLIATVEMSGKGRAFLVHTDQGWDPQQVRWKVD